jgi:hypothetical protein
MAMRESRIAGACRNGLLKRCRETVGRFGSKPLPLLR